MIFVLQTIGVLDTANVSYAALTMSSDLKFTPAVFGIGAGIFFVGYLAFQIPVSVVVEKRSARRWITLVIASSGAVAMGTSVINSDMQFYVMRFALGACSAGLFPALVVYSSHWFRAKERGLVYSVLIAAFAVSQIIAGPVSTQILGMNWLNVQGWRWMFLIEGLPALIMAPVAYLLLADRPGSVRWLKVEQRQWLKSQLDEENKLKSQNSGYSWKKAIKEREVLTLAAIYGTWLAANYGLLFFLPSMVSEITQLPFTSIGLVLAGVSACAFVSLILLGRSSDRRREKKLHAFIPLVIGASALVLCTFVHQSPLLSLILLGITVVGFGSAFGIFWTLPTMFLSETSAAVSIGLIGAIGNFGGFIGPATAGYLRSSTGAFVDSNLLFAGLALAAALLILTLRKTTMPTIESVPR